MDSIASVFGMVVGFVVIACAALFYFERRKRQRIEIDWKRIKNKEKAKEKNEKTKNDSGSVGVANDTANLLDTKS